MGTEILTMDDDDDDEHEQLLSEKGQQTAKSFLPYVYLKS